MYVCALCACICKVPGCYSLYLCPGWARARARARARVRARVRARGRARARFSQYLC